MPKPFRRLRFELGELDIDQVTLAEKLGRGDRYISGRMNGKGSWSLWEAFEMMRIIGAPLSKIEQYFPLQEIPAPGRGGKTA